MHHQKNIYQSIQCSECLKAPAENKVPVLKNRTLNSKFCNFSVNNESEK